MNLQIETFGGQSDQLGDAIHRLLTRRDHISQVIPFKPTLVLAYE